MKFKNSICCVQYFKEILLLAHFAFTNNETVAFLCWLMLNQSAIVPLLCVVFIWFLLCSCCYSCYFLSVYATADCVISKIINYKDVKRSANYWFFFLCLRWKKEYRFNIDKICKQFIIWLNVTLNFQRGILWRYQRWISPCQSFVFEFFFSVALVSDA